MQPRNCPAVVPPVLVLVLWLELLGEGVPADAQPAASSTPAVAAAAAIIDLLNTDLLNHGSTVLPRGRRLDSHPSRLGGLT
jgi:hypothetical protein